MSGVSHGIYAELPVAPANPRNEGNVDTSNSGAQRIYCHTHVQVIGRHFSILYPQNEAVPESYPARLEAGHSEHKWRRFRQNGSRRSNVISYSVMIRDFAKCRAADEAPHIIGPRIKAPVSDRFRAVHRKCIENFGSSPDSVRATNAAMPKQSTTVQR